MEKPDSEKKDMNIETSSDIFKLADITEAVKCSNFIKGLGPDCFDGNKLKANQTLCDKISYEILNALNQGDIPEYLRVGRMVPL